MGNFFLHDWQVEEENEPCTSTSLSAGTPATASKVSMFCVYTRRSTPFSFSSRKKAWLKEGQCLPGQISRAR